MVSMSIRLFVHKQTTYVNYDRYIYNYVNYDNERGRNSS